MATGSYWPRCWTVQLQKLIVQWSWKMFPFSLITSPCKVMFRLRIHPLPYPEDGGPGIFWINVLVAVVQSLSCIWLWDPMNCSTPDLPVPHLLPKFAQVHVHGIGDDIQPSYPLLPSPPPAFNLSQLQCLFQWISCSHQVAKVLVVNGIGDRSLSNPLTPVD